jgi:hypothetical protein
MPPGTLPTTHRLTSTTHSQPFINPRSPSQIRLISSLIPWPITITTTHPSGLKISDILEEMYECLQKHVTSVEWFIVEEKKRLTVGETMRRNSKLRGGERGERDGVRRVDWLGEWTVVRGLEKDERFITERQVGKEKIDTWVLVMGRNC